MYDPGTLTPYTYYYWRIVAWDNHDACRAGPRWQFRTEYVNSPPNEPSNPNPANGSTEIPVTTDLCWTGGDPDSGDYVTYDVYFGRSFPLTKIKSNISGTSCTIEDLNYSMKYYWNVTAWDNHHNKNEGPLWSFSTKTDTSSPSLAITQPKKGWLYFNLFGVMKKFPILITTIAIGQIEVIATASDTQSGMNRVEFYLDDELKYTDYTAEGNQYTWLWDESGNIFPHLLKIVAYDNCGQSSTLTRGVWKIF